MWEIHHAYSDMHGAIRVLLCSQAFEAAGGSVVHALSRCKHDMGALWGYMRKHSKEHPPPFWQTCKVLHPWMLFHKTTVLLTSLDSDVLVTADSKQLFFVIDIGGLGMVVVNEWRNL